MSNYVLFKTANEIDVIYGQGESVPLVKNNCEYYEYTELKTKEV